MKIGDRFGRWEIKSEPYFVDYKVVAALCECGTYRVVRYSSIASGDSNSCGCLAKEKARDRVKTHGLSDHPLYYTYQDMIRRCYDIRRKDYKHYGGRGIKVCKRWRDKDKGLHNFIEDMGEKPKQMELERINVDGDYCKSNCKWLDRRGQVNNTRFNRSVEYRGYTLNISEWAYLLGIKSNLLRDRLDKLEQSTATALSTPFLARSCEIQYNGGTYKMKEFLELVRCNQTNYSRVVHKNFNGDISKFVESFGGVYVRNIINKRSIEDVISILEGNLAPLDHYEERIVEKRKEQSK